MTIENRRLRKPIPPWMNAESDRTRPLASVKEIARQWRCRPSSGAQIDPKEIFALIVKADEAVKYATGGKAAARVGRARELLIRARDEAAAIDNPALVDQAEQRLSDLDRLSASGGA